MIDYELENKVVVVTGGTSGIGRAIAVMFAEYNATVCVIGRSEQHAQESMNVLAEYNHNNCYFIGDLSDDSCCYDICEKIINKFGRIDILVNCAGILTKSRIEDITRKEWDEVLASNLSSCFFMSQAAEKNMKKTGFGRIINISSNAGRMGGYENSQSYTASKGGMIAITMGMARQLAQYGITVNVVCPGTVESEMTRIYDNETKKRLIDRIPLGRMAKPEEVAGTVCFLASKYAAGITGAIIDVNGGMYMG